MLLYFYQYLNLKKNYFLSEKQYSEDCESISGIDDCLRRLQTIKETTTIGWYHL